MKPKLTLVLEDCIEVGIQAGWNRAYKHADNPEPDAVRQAIYTAIMNELWELFEFGEDEQ